MKILRPQCIFWTGAHAHAPSSVGFQYILQSRQSQNRRLEKTTGARTHSGTSSRMVATKAESGCLQKLEDRDWELRY